MLRSLLPALAALTATPALAGYVIDHGTWSTLSTRYGVAGDPGVFERAFDCEDAYDQGVIRSWYLRERNEADFRSSYHFCREMETDGTLAAGYTKQTHFNHTGSYTQGDSSIPLDMLPVGVRLKWNNATWPVTYDKLVDVNVIYNDAASIIALDSGWSGAGYALGRAGSTTTLECPLGRVMTGLRVLEKTTGTGGSNQSEIVGVRIVCTDLDPL
ncbi:MAG: hypothetical protein R3F60_02130 [bacterium]